MQCPFWWKWYWSFIHDIDLYSALLYHPPIHSYHSVCKDCCFLLLQKKNGTKSAFHQQPCSKPKVFLPFHVSKLPQCPTLVFRLFTHGRLMVIRMLIVVVSAFFICWAPFHAQRLLFMFVTLFKSWNRQLMNIHYILFILSGKTLVDNKFSFNKIFNFRVTLLF